MSSIKLFSIILLPMLVMYMLMIINIFERRLNPDKTRFTKKIFNLRDILLATLILDLVAVSSTMRIYFDRDIGYHAADNPVIPFLLFILHLSFLIISPSFSKRNQNAPNDVSKIKSFSLFVEMYVGIVILFTNALTIKNFLTNTLF